MAACNTSLTTSAQKRQFCIDNYKTHTMQQLGEATGYLPNSCCRIVREYCRANNLPKPEGARSKLTPEQIVFINENYKKNLTAGQIAKKLGVTKTIVQSHTRSMGVSRNSANYDRFLDSMKKSREFKESIRKKEFAFDESCECTKKESSSINSIMDTFEHRIAVLEAEFDKTGNYSLLKKINEIEIRISAEASRLKAREGVDKIEYGYRIARNE